MEKGDGMQTLLIAQGMDAFRAALVETLGGKYRILSCGDGETALAMLRTEKPDILLLDLMLPGLDGISLLQNAGKHIPPVVLATTRFINGYVQQAARDLGIGYLMMMPCSVSAVGERLEDLILHLSQPCGVQDPQAMVSDHLSNLSISPKLGGFHQLRVGIPLFAQDPHQSLSKELYPAVARLCGCDDGRQVERSIRKAIQTAWEQGDLSVWASYFPPDARGEISRPTNKDFISRLADILAKEIHGTRNKK